MKRKYLLLALLQFLVSKELLAPPPPPPALTITEIMYNSPEENDSLNFIEITAGGGFSQNLDSSEFLLGFEFDLPDSIVSYGDVFLIVQDSVAFENVYGISAFESESFSSFSLADSLVLQGLYYPDIVVFGTGTPWPNQTNGFGHSLSRCVESGSTSFEPTTQNSGVVINGQSIFASPGEFSWTNCSTVGVASSHSRVGLKLYPNPNTGTFTLDFSQLQQEATLRIRNTMSQILFERQVSKGSTSLTQNIKFNKGIYLLELDDGNDCQHQYMVVTE